MKQIGLTYFDGQRSPRGRPGHSTWHSLVAVLSGARPTRRGRQFPLVIAEKDKRPGFAMATFRENYRTKDRVEFAYAVGLDLDKRVDWHVLRDRFAATDSFLHTTWSSTPEEPRARAFLRLSRPVTGEEYVRVYQFCAGIAEAGGLEVDRKASDPSRLWFLPAIQPGGVYEWSVGRGAPIDVAYALAVVPATPPPISAPPPSAPRTSSDAVARAEAYIAKCEPAISGAGGHNVTFLLAQKLVRGFCLDEGTALHLLSVWNQNCQPPWKEWELRRKLRQALERGHMAAGALLDAPLRRAG